MENENLDLDVKPAGNKDLWLFLIIVDIVLLCVFGFFLYRHFSATLFHVGAEITQPAAETMPVEPVVLQDEPQPVAEVLPAKPEQPAVVQVEETSVAEVLAAQAKAAEKAPSKKVETAPATPTEKKESILVEVNPKSKYRKVTFRWYGAGEKVSVVSGFTMSKPKALTKKQDYWETTLSIAPGTYKFLYVVDGQNQRDPYAPERDGRSVVVVE